MGAPLPRRAGGRIDERDLGPFAADPEIDDAALGALFHLHIALLETLAGLDEHVVLAVLVEHRLPRDVERAGSSLPSRVTRADTPAFSRRIGLIELQRHVEQPRHARRLEEVGAVGEA